MKVLAARGLLYDKHLVFTGAMNIIYSKYNIQKELVYA